MTASLWVTILWILVISFVGRLPMRFHKRFGFPLLFLFPFVLGYLGWEMGAFWALGLFVAGLSIYRYPARYFGLALWRRVSGAKRKRLDLWLKIRRRVRWYPTF